MSISARRLPTSSRFVAALEKVLEFGRRLGRPQGCIWSISIWAAGSVSRYRDEVPPAVKDYLERLFQRLGKRELRILF